ncbi:murein hydrolase activator EnvC family protein [Sphingomonas abietis]|uniref:Peptidoglycan DD-metalloendopeptidase family protein n=1 Tax=Sphingomonas abietis TaxID=3012344 RepID=A0ABY7NNK2_9SPHN|nr:peptidoglycan DD-metalloendopeptidase family protein [Sphingomonas abietis]WBO22938.1 peptidoglycan DD-metalloendopeptidase family protein [Sphingomonas abietis]
MHRRRILLAATAIAALATTAQAPGLDDARVSLLAAKQAAAAAEAHAAALSQAAEDAGDEAGRARAHAAALGMQVQAAQADIAAARARIRLIATLQQAARDRIGDKQGPILSLVAALQTMARRPPALAIAQPGSIDDIVHIRLLLADTLPVIQARTAGLRADLDRQTQLRGDAERAIAALAASQTLLGQRQAELGKVEQTALRRSQRLADQAADERQHALGLGEEARDAADRMQTLENAGDVRARLARLPGPELRPAGADDALPGADGPPRYALPASGEVATGFGEVAPSGVRSRGLTLATAPGARVTAPAAGMIVFAKPFRSYGQVVIIAHGGGWTTTVTGLAAIDAKVGQRVARGDALGTAGASVPLITTELRRDNHPIDIVAMAQAN